MGRGRGKANLPYFLPSTVPLVQISFSSQHSVAIKIKDSGHNFC